METIIVRILAQVFENYNVENVDMPHWKRKGGKEFEVEVGYNTFLYEEDTCKEAFKGLLLNYSNKMFKYEFVSCEPIFERPVVLDKTLCAELIRRKFNLANNE